MKNKIIEHIPHCSLKLPRIFKKQKKLIPNNEITNFNYTMTDLWTDELFSSNKWTHLKAKVSRIACDCEKFLEDSQEYMSRFGLGVIYTKNHQGKNMMIPSEEYRKKIIKKYYLPHHRKLDKIVSKNLTKHKIILVDCHSFSDEIIMTEHDKRNLPDICIGMNEFYSSQKLLNFTIDYFKKLGLTVSVNSPYSGAMIPDYLLSQNQENFYSIMLEVNRDIYLPNLQEIDLLESNLEKRDENKLKNTEKVEKNQKIQKLLKNKNILKNNQKIKNNKLKKIIIKSEKFKKIKEIINNYLNIILKMEDL